MKTNPKLKQITEGSTDFIVFNSKNKDKGPGSKDKLPFYNPAMELNRDLSILICQFFVNNNKKALHFLDGLAATGIRGIRIKNEVTGKFEITVNDWNKQAYKLIKKNIKLNNLENIETLNKNLNIVLSEKKYNYIDIDPFGSPVYFIDSAMRSIKNKGIIGVTATDTATLCGVYPHVCMRRYQATSYHSFFMKEIALRILLGFIGKEAIKYDKGIKPFLCYSTDHYFRVYIKVRKGVDYADETIKNIFILKSDDIDFSKKTNTDIGPLWTGKLQNKKMIKEIRSIIFEKQLNSKNNLWKLLDLLEQEADATSLFYTTDDISSYLEMSPPRLETVFKELKKDGFNVTRTHFSPTGFKTDAPWKKIEQIFKNDSQLK